MKEALLWDRVESGIVKCRLCRHGCVIKDGKKGLCGVRQNLEGTLYTLVYDKVVSTNIDPIEKKPLFHFAPGSRSFSIATVGCNFRCSFCQNYSISQMPQEFGRIEGENYSPAEIADLALRNDCRSISYTYTEPTIFYELARATMIEAKERGLLNVFVTNGYMTRDMLDDAKGLLDAANVDLKAFNDNFYTHYCKAKREGVLDSMAYMKEVGIWVEVTTLLIPTLNDDLGEVQEMAQFIRSKLGSGTPWHVSRFYPRYKEQDLPPTDVRALTRVREIGLEAGLHYVYVGNVPGDDGEKTRCPNCTELLVDRTGYSIRNKALKDGLCTKCGYRVDGREMY